MYSEYQKRWYKENRERLLEVRRRYNKLYSARPEVIERARLKNASPEAKEKRKAYKQSDSGKVAERRYRIKNMAREKERVIRTRLKTRYGLTPEDVDVMRTIQANSCRICNKVFDGVYHIDHCHATNKVRGLLCTSCNMGLGLFKDEPGRLLSAIDYLLYAVQKDDGTQEDIG